MPAPLGSFQSNSLPSPGAAWADHQKARSIPADGSQGEGKLVGDFRPVVGPLKQASGLVVIEGGFEAHHIQRVSVLDEGGLLVISPSTAAVSAHFS